VADASKTYGQDDSASLTGTIIGIQNGDPISASYASAGSAATATVGSYAINAVLSDAGTGDLANYNVTVNAGTLTVDAATLTVNVADASKTYGQDDSASLTGTIIGIQNGDPISASYASAGSAATATVGSYAINAVLSDAGTGDLANYNVTVNAGTLTVDAATLTVNVADASKTYGQDDSASLTGTIIGIQNGDPISASYASAGSAATATVGSYAINAVLSDAGTGDLANYNVTVNAGTLTVDAATLTVNVADASKTYGQDDSASLTGTIIGIQNGDPISASYASAGSAATATVGSYAINAVLSDAGTGDLANYNVTVNAGTLTVDAATLTVNV